jgi:hypothetical protein
VRVVVVLLALLGSVVASFGCGAASPRGDAALEQAARRLRDMIDKTADDVFPNAVTTVQPGSTGRKSCGAGSHREDEDYSIVVAATPGQIDEAIAATRRFWESQGRSVRLEGDRSDLPRLYSNFDGFLLELSINRPQMKAYVLGSTPCFSVD